LSDWSNLGCDREHNNRRVIVELEYVVALVV